MSRKTNPSYPARGTWIEIVMKPRGKSLLRVVPRTGYVDRNTVIPQDTFEGMQSYPARGTWIEIRAQPDEGTSNEVVPRTGYVDRNALDLHYAILVPIVVPRTGYVDRNTDVNDTAQQILCRTPHGVRG